jgi:LPS export ABC transporter permease LptF/LPS export ABC transporter permease LptG
MRRPSTIFFFYLWREVLPLATLAFTILTFLIAIQQLGRQISLTVLSLATPDEAVRFILYSLPSICLITLPMGLLIGMLMALNRLKSDSELTAALSCGLSPLILYLPLLLVGLLGTGITYALTLDLLPRTTRSLLDFRTRILTRSLTSRIRAQSFETRFPGYLIYIQRLDPANGNWIGVFIIRQTDNGETLLLTASEGQLRLMLEPEIAIEVELKQGVSFTADEAADRRAGAVFDKSVIRLSASKELAAEEPNLSTRLQALTMPELGTFIRRAPPTPPTKRIAEVEWHRRLSLPLASLTLTLVAIVITLRAHRPRGKAIGIALGFGISLLYYLCLIAGQNLAISGQFPVWLGVWSPNLVGVIGVALLLRIRFPGRRRTTAIARGGSSEPAARRAGAFSKLSFIKPWRVTALINYLIWSEVIRVFLISAAILVLTTLVFTLFDIIPSVSRGNFGAGFVAGYLFFLSPQILYYTAPFAFLIAVLVAYVILSRSNQLVVLSGSGLSTFRISLPILLTGLLVTGGLFGLSEAILPETNREQDARYQQIKGRKGEQAALALGRRWIFGTGGRVIGFLYSEPDKKLLNASVYEIDRVTFRLHRVVYLPEARWKVGTIWESNQQGWEFIPEGGVFSRTPPRSIDLGEAATAFRRTVNESAKLSARQLADYIGQLQRLGVPSNAERIDLWRRYTHPLVCLTLLLLSWPILAGRKTHSRREGLTGIGFGVILSLAFWLLNQSLEMAGKQALLPVWIAVGGAHLLTIPFSTYLLLRRHTH